MSANDQLAIGHIRLAAYHFRKAVALMTRHHGRGHALRACLALFDIALNGRKGGAA